MQLNRASSDPALALSAYRIRQYQSSPTKSIMRKIIYERTSFPGAADGAIDGSHGDTLQGVAGEVSNADSTSTSANIASSSGTSAQQV